VKSKQLVLNSKIEISLYKRLLEIPDILQYYYRQVFPEYIEYFNNQAWWWEEILPLLVNLDDFKNIFKQSCIDKKIYTLKNINYRNLMLLVDAKIEINWIKLRIETHVVDERIWTYL
jgi:hypothetical protein